MDPRKPRHWLLALCGLVPILVAGAVLVQAVRLNRPIYLQPDRPGRPDGMRFFVQDTDGAKFWVDSEQVRPRGDGESMATWHTAVKAELAALGWTILDPPGSGD